MKLFLVVLLTVGAIGAQPRRYNWRVVSGADAPDGAYPFIVKLQYFDEQFCAGSIIDKFTVVTAAHCVDWVSPNNMVIVAGTNQLQSGGDEYNISAIRVHENFVYDDDDNAILKIVGPIRYSDKVQPIELQTKYIGGDVQCLGMGWGDLRFRGSRPNNLQHISLKAVTTETCKEAYDILKTFHITVKHICTFTKVGEGMCNRDSGGPLICDNKLTGIVSGGYPCAVGYPDVFIRVSSYLNWINDNTLIIEEK